MSDTLFAFAQFQLLASPESRLGASLNSGGVLCIKGESGSGKTTLLRMLGGLHPFPEGATCLFKDQSKEQCEAEVWRTRVHYLPQVPAFRDQSIEENLVLPFSLKASKHREHPDVTVIKRYLQTLGLSHLEGSKRMQNCSIGEKMRLSLIRSLLLEPSVLLCDELLAPLDAGNRVKVVNLLGQWLTEAPDRGLVICGHDPMEDTWPGASICHLPGRGES